MAKPHTLDHLKTDLIQHDIDVCALSEPWLEKHRNDETFLIDGYELYRRDRKMKRGGGVAIYIKSNVESCELTMSHDNATYEVLWIKTY